jgi:hypothetical protein
LAITSVTAQIISNTPLVLAVNKFFQRRQQAVEGLSQGAFIPAGLGMVCRSQRNAISAPVKWLKSTQRQRYQAQRTHRRCHAALCKIIDCAEEYGWVAKVSQLRDGSMHRWLGPTVIKYQLLHCGDMPCRRSPG